MTRTFEPRGLAALVPSAPHLSHGQPAPGMAAQRTLAQPAAPRAAGAPHGLLPPPACRRNLSLELRLERTIAECRAIERIMLRAQLAALAVIAAAWAIGKVLS